MNIGSVYGLNHEAFARKIFDMATRSIAGWNRKKSRHSATSTMMTPLPSIASHPGQKSSINVKFIYSEAVERALRKFGCNTADLGRKRWAYRSKDNFDVVISKLPEIYEDLVFMKNNRSQHRLPRMGSKATTCRCTRLMSAMSNRWSFTSMSFVAEVDELEEDASDVASSLSLETNYNKPARLLPPIYKSAPNLTSAKSKSNADLKKNALLRSKTLTNMSTI